MMHSQQDGEHASLGGDWQAKFRRALGDEDVRSFVRDALIEGYDNAAIPQGEALVAEIFDALSAVKTADVGEVLEHIRTDVNGRWQGRSIRERWSDYYRQVESLNISRVLLPHVVGTRLLEVGVGRGWISYQLDRLSDSKFSITQTDIHDYREDAVRECPRFRFVPVENDNPLPFAPGEFDTIVMVYVLHHCPPEPWRSTFFRQLAALAPSRIVILDDTYLKAGQQHEHRHSQTQASSRFESLTESQKQLALHFSCTFSNKVDGGGGAIPAPGIFRELSDLTAELEQAFTPASVSAQYLGIPSWKVYLNAEGILVIER